MFSPVAELLAQLEARGFRQDTQAKTMAFFATESCTGFDLELQDTLKQLAQVAGQVNVRLCLHQSPVADFHDMLILEWPQRRYYRPHRHLNKAETIHLIEGDAAALIFDDNGELQNGYRLSNGENSLLRIGDACWHALLPLSQPVLYHEAKKGPFLGAADAEYPSWAPDGSNAQQATDYLQQLQRRAGLA